MSLDVYLKAKTQERREERIYIREDGGIKTISREEWDERFPDREPFVTPATDEAHTEVYWANITHNLGSMADEAGIYKYLWRPDEIGVSRAWQLIDPLASGLRKLEKNPDRFKKFNPSNGWGDYEGLVFFVRAYLEACKAHPDASVSVSR